MKKSKFYSKLAMLCLSAILAFGACSSESGDPTDISQTGSLRLGLTNQAFFPKATTRAVNEDLYRQTDNYTVQIIDEKGEKVSDALYSSIKNTTFKLNNGNYTVKAFYGEESNASQNTFLVTGQVNISVAANDQAVNIECYPTCGKLRANFDASMANHFTAYSITYETETLSAAGATVNWTQTNTDPWYVKLKAEGEEVKATIHLTRKDDGTSSQVVKSYSGMKPNQSWTMNIAPHDDNGSLGITITIDESTEDIIHDIEVPSDWI